MEKLQKNKQIILTIFLVTILFLSGILIGLPNKSNIQIVYILIDVTAIIYMVKKCIKKEKIINDKIDIFVLIISISSCMPIIFNTYASLSNSISFILKYTSIFLAYLITKDIVRNNKKIANYLIYIILFIGVTLVILGIDRLTYHYFKPVLELIGLSDIYQGEIRMTSLFGYANSFAVMTASGIFLALGQNLITDKAFIKGINQVIIFILFVGLVLSLSRMMFLVMGVISIIYLFFNKGRKKKLEIVETFINTGILAVSYSNIFMKILISGNYIGIWTSLAGLAILSCVVAITFTYINKKIIQLEKRNFIKVSLIAISILIIIIIIIMKTPENLILFNTEKFERTVERHLSNIKGQTRYLLEFEIDAISIGNNKNFQIIVEERDEYWKVLKSTNIQFGNYKGNKEIELYTDEKTKDIYIVFCVMKPSNYTKLEIKNFEVNDKKVNLNYKFLPYDLVSKMENMNLKTQSVVDRGTFIKDAFKLIKSNWLFGIGGNGWDYRYGEVQEESYISREVHSYPVQVLLEFGIIGIISYITIVIILLKQSYDIIKKKSQPIYNSVFFAALAIILHSFLDFDLSFFYLLLMLFLFFGIMVAFKEKKCDYVNKNYLAKGIVIGIITIIMIVNIKMLIAHIVVEKSITAKTSFQKRYEIYENCNNLLPYNSEYKIKMIDLIETYKNQYSDKKIEYCKKSLEYIKYLIKHEKYYNQFEMQSKLVINSIELIETEEKREMIKNIEEGYILIKNNKPQKNSYIKDTHKRKERIKNIAETLMQKSSIIDDENLKIEIRQLAKQFYLLNIDEYEENKKDIENYVDDNYMEKEKFLSFLLNYKEEAIKRIEEI